jgi:Fe-S oxidoreductase
MVNVDFAILGLDETCCGDTARRLGHEYLFQVFAEQNIDVFNQVKFNRIVTQCPHCFNTLKNEYPQLGGDFRVQHYSEYLNELSLPLEINSHDGNGKNPIFTYHDPCYIGRYNQIYSQPRKLLSDAHINIVEMTRNTENSFCCGGGGGGMWLETEADTRINHQRLNDALQVQSDVVATACPYCLLMFDDAIRSKGVGNQIEVMDISEILEQQLSNSGSENPQVP